MTARPLWLAQRERGSHLLMRLITGLALHLGRPAARALLYPICAYFLLFSPRARRASRSYLGRALSRRAGPPDVFAHYLCFARTILDRVYFIAGRTESFDCMIEGLDVLRGALAQGRGCLLFGAHFGSFDILRVLGAQHCPVRVNVLMHQDNAEKLNAVLARLDSELPMQVIALGQPQTMLRVSEALARGEIVGLLADRVVAGDKLRRCLFLGSAAPLPEGPFVLAAAVRAPIVLFSATYCGGRKYRIRFEAFADPIVRSREDRALAVTEHCQRYAKWLEAICRAAPYNWFNFYDFWADEALE